MSFPDRRERLLLVAKVFLPWIAILVAAAALAALPAQGGVIISGTGRTFVNSTTYHDVAAQADLSIAGNTLTIILTNTSPRNTTDPADVLSSFYFDIQRNGARPSLTYASATGPLYKIVRGGTDVAYHYLPPSTPGGTTGFIQGAGISDLRALQIGDGTWQLRSMNAAITPFAGFGIGTVGNNALDPNGFQGNYVTGPGQKPIDFSISRGSDIEPTGQNNQLVGSYLLRDTGTFSFTLSGTGEWSNSDIRGEATFGFGTGPDGTITTAPEPSSLALGLAAAASLAWGRFRRTRSRRRC